MVDFQDGMGARKKSLGVFLGGGVAGRGRTEVVGNGGGQGGVIGSKRKNRMDRIGRIEQDSELDITAGWETSEMGAEEACKVEIP